MESIKQTLLSFFKILVKASSSHSVNTEIIVNPKNEEHLLLLAKAVIGAPDLLIFSRLNSYSQEVFKVSLEGTSHVFILKANKKSSAHTLQKELGIIAFLDIKARHSYLVPETLGYFSNRAMELLVSVWVPQAKTFSQFSASKEVLCRAAHATRVIQKNLKTFSHSGTHVNRVNEACEKISKFSENFMGFRLDLSTDLKSIKTSIPGITRAGSFSDRSAENWLYTNDSHLYAIDFGLTTNGHPLEDWVTLIDSKGFVSLDAFSRSDLFNIFCSEVSELPMRYDHCEMVSLYRNIMQACIFYPLSKEKSKWHFEKSLASAEYLSLSSVAMKIKSIL